MFKQKLEAFYNKYYKILMLIPIILLVLSLIFVGFKYAKTGEIFNRDVTLKGGITSTIYTDKDINTEDLQNKIPNSLVKKLTDFSTGQQVGIIVEASDISADNLKESLQKELAIELTDQNYSVEETGSSLGESFYKELITAVLIAFIFMAIVIFITFRTLIPSAAVVLSALIDIIIPLAIINLLNIKVSSAGVVAFLLLIGYSVDTDILLTTRALKRYNAPLFDRMYSSMKTGLTMTFCAIAVMVTGIILSTTPIIKEMFFIILLGLITDIFSTYFTNASILKIYCKRKNIA